MYCGRVAGVSTGGAGPGLGFSTTDVGDAIVASLIQVVGLRLAQRLIGKIKFYSRDLICNGGGVRREDQGGPGTN